MMLSSMFFLVVHSSELARATICWPIQASVAKELETKRNVHGIWFQHEGSALAEKEIIYRNDLRSGWFQAMWTVVDLVLGQFFLTPVSGAQITWSRTIPKGSYSQTAPQCTSFLAFGQSLAGLQTTGVVLRAGSTSVKCMDATIAKQITENFSSLCSDSGTKNKYSCNGNSWVTVICGGPEISVSVEGDINGCTCGATETVTIRPCNSYNFGGVGSNSCNSITTTLEITIYYTLPTASPTETPTASPTNLPTETPTAPPTNLPTETPTALPTNLPTETPTTPPTNLLTQRPTAQPTTSSIINSGDDVDKIKNFDIVDRDDDTALIYHEIAFAIADTNKDGKLSLSEYEAARAVRIFVDTSYMPTNSDDIDITKDFDIIDKNVDGFLNYDEVAFAIADTTKDGRLSYEEYEAALAVGIFPDTSYTIE